MPCSKGGRSTAPPDPPPIYTLAGCPIAGQLGPNAALEYANQCPQCKRWDEVLRHLEYVFDAWNGEEIITTGKWYAVTAALRDTLERAGLRGFTFRDMTAVPAEYFADTSPIPWDSVPDFFELRINSRLDPAVRSPSGWWLRRDGCPVCHRPFWDRTDASIEGLFAAAAGKIGPPRLVTINGWDGADIFYHEDPGPPLVTEGFVQLLQSRPAKGVAFHPAKWA